jgi:hypothetical protein
MLRRTFGVTLGWRRGCRDILHGPNLGESRWECAGEVLVPALGRTIRGSMAGWWRGRIFSSNLEGPVRGRVTSYV